MVPMVISCMASDWQNLLRNMLSQKVEVDLTSACLEFNDAYLEDLAKENTMFLIKDENSHVAFFRKKKT